MIYPAESSHQVRCSICETQLEGDFCHQCGQKFTGHRVNVIDLLSAFFSGLLSLERGILGNVKLLFLKPQFVVENYWHGYRKYLYAPGQMIFYALLIIGLHASLVDTYILGLDVELDIKEETWRVFLSPQLFFILFLLPLYALTSYVVFFKLKKSFLEHLIASTYSFSFIAIMSTIIGDVLYYFDVVSLSFSTYIFLIGLFIWSTRIFASKKKWYLKIAFFFLQSILFLAVIMAILLTLVGTENIQWE